MFMKNEASSSVKERKKERKKDMNRKIHIKKLDRRLWIRNQKKNTAKREKENANKKNEVSKSE